MYERNAIIIDRYFNNMFGYNTENNIKSNFENYCELIKALENYKNSVEEEEEIIIEYDIIANKIRDIQNKEDNLYQKSLKFQEERNNIFQSIDEDVNLLHSKLNDINNNIKNINEEIQENAENFANVVAEFNEKSIVRNRCGKNRRTVEIDYNKKLNDTLDNYKNIDITLEKKAKQFIELDTNEIKDELKNEIQKNGAKEKIPFQESVIEQAILLSIDTQKKETEILANIYEKTNKLFAEIKNNSVKIEKHKKIILDSTSKINFISAIKEYLVQFLDNERLAVVNGEKEYNNLMKDACKNLNDDLIQIKNLYTLLLKEISRKATKKSYTDLYNIEYLKDLENTAEEFENQVKKLKLPVAVINPNYWRINGMKKIYEIFNKSVTENYNRDLKEFINTEEDSDADDENQIEENNIQENVVENNIVEKKNNVQDENEDDDKDNQNDNKLKKEIDRKIDIILGMQDNGDENASKKTEIDDSNENVYEEDNWEDIDDIIENDEDEWEEDDLEEEIEEDDDEDEWEDEEEWENEDDEEDDEDYEEEWKDENIKNETEENEEEWEDEEEYEEDNEDEWEEEDIKNESKEDDDEWEDADIKDEEEYEEDDEWEDKYKSSDKKQKYNNIIGKKDNIKNEKGKVLDEDVDYDIWGNNITTRKEKKSKKNAAKKVDKDWENEFINIEKKDKNKKKGFFNKFKK